jgi:hypothetical protein
MTGAGRAWTRMIACRRFVACLNRRGSRSVAWARADRGPARCACRAAVTRVRLSISHPSLAWVPKYIFIFLAVVLLVDLPGVVGPPEPAREERRGPVHPHIAARELRDGAEAFFLGGWALRRAVVDDPPPAPEPAPEALEPVAPEVLQAAVRRPSHGRRVRQADLDPSQRQRPLVGRRDLGVENAHRRDSRRDRGRHGAGGRRGGGR